MNANKPQLFKDNTLQCVANFCFIGDAEFLWKIEKLRSESVKQHTIASAISCAKVKFFS